MGRARILTSLIVLLVLVGGYERVRESAVGLLRPSQAAAAQGPTGIMASATCSVSKAIRDEPPKDPNADRFGFGDWYVNADRTIWVAKNSWRAGRDGNKVIWIRPAGTKLVVTGRRLDAAAPPLRATSDRGYPTGFTVTGLYFPTEGCWEITAKAGSKELRFVTEVARPSTPLSPSPAR